MPFCSLNQAPKRGQCRFHLECKLGSKPQHRYCAETWEARQSLKNSPVATTAAEKAVVEQRENTGEKDLELSCVPGTLHTMVYLD